jgi:hypothetical protein
MRRDKPNAHERTSYSASDTLELPQFPSPLRTGIRKPTEIHDLFTMTKSRPAARATGETVFPFRPPRLPANRSETHLRDASPRR